MSDNTDRAMPSARATAVEPVPVSPLRDGIAIADLDAAIRIMLDAHRGQLDKGGQPYFLHPLRVMLACTTNEERIVAVLHDVIEDSAVTVADLRHLFGPSVADAVNTLTRGDGETYRAFILRIAKHPLACRVKLADLADNMDLSRLGREPGMKDMERQIKYQNATQLLSAALGQKDAANA